MATEGASTTQRIEVTDAANITLDGVNISTSTGSALKITDDATFNVNIILADGSNNILTSGAGGAGLEKSGDGVSIGKLTIGTEDNSKKPGELTATGTDAAGIGGGRVMNARNIEITGGIISANGGSAAGIGGGSTGNGSYITISGGKVTATGNGGGAGIGGGVRRDASYIYITGGEVIAKGENGTGAGIGGNRNADHIYISGGSVTATGGAYAAGIGSGQYANVGASVIEISGGKVIVTGGIYAPGIGGPMGSVTGIKITGGVVEATGKDDCAIGGAYTTSSGNELNGDVVLIASCTDSSHEPLTGFDSGFEKGIVFTKKGSEDWQGDVYGEDVIITENVQDPTAQVLPIDVELPAPLAIDNTEKVTVSSEVTLTAATGAGFIVGEGGTLINEGTLDISDSDLVCNDSGIITTRTHFYLADGKTPYGTDDYYQTYKTSAGVQSYTNLPNPDTTKLSRNSLAASEFLNWYYLNGTQKVAIKDGDDVLLNQHKFYEDYIETYAIAISETSGGSIISNVAEAAKDETVTLTVAPDEGYQLQTGSLKVVAGSTEVALTDKGDGTYTFSMPEANVVVSAIFELVPGPDPTPTDTVTLIFKTDEGSWNGITETTLTGAPDAVIIPPSYPYTDATRTCIGWFDEQGNQIISGITTFGEVTGVVTARLVDTPGWHQNATGWWYVYDLSNNYYTNCWALINSAWFYFNESGYCLEYTWGYINGEWYFFGWGGYMQTGWQWISGSWYFLDRNSGAMKCGWVHDGVWYYCDAALGGAMYDNCWAYINGNWYGFNEGGSMTQGWSWSYAYDGWFYLQPDTGHMLYGWQYIGGHWYYFFDNGLMAANTYVGTYWLGSDGAWS